MSPCVYPFVYNFMRSDLSIHRSIYTILCLLASLADVYRGLSFANAFGCLHACTDAMMFC